MRVRRAALSLTALALLAGASPAGAKPTVPGGSSGTSYAGWRNGHPEQDYYVFIGTLAFGDGSYSGHFYIDSENAYEPYGGLVLRVDNPSFDTPWVARCTDRHTPGVDDALDVNDNNSSLVDAAAVVRCTGHLGSGPDTTTTLSVVYTSSYHDPRFGDYSWWDGTYVG